MYFFCKNFYLSAGGLEKYCEMMERDQRQSKPLPAQLLRQLKSTDPSRQGYEPLRKHKLFVLFTVAMRSASGARMFRLQECQFHLGKQVNQLVES